MVGVEHLHAVGKLFGVRRFLVPGQVEYPVEIPRNHRIFGRGGLHFVETVKLLEALRLDLPGQFFGEDFCTVLVLLLAVVPQLRMDRFQLLAQEVILLRAVDILPNGGSDLLFDFGNLQLVIEAAFKSLQPFDDGFLLQQLLLDFEPHAHGRHGHVDIGVGVGTGLQLRENILADFAVGQKHVPHHLSRRAEIGFLENLVAVHGHNLVGDRVIVPRFELHRTGAGAINALREDAQSAPGKLRHLFDSRHRPDGIDIGRGDFVFFRFALSADK